MHKMTDNMQASLFSRQMSFKTYKKMKLNMLQADFCIDLTQEELDRYSTLETESKVDQFCIAILNDRWR